MNCQTCRTEIEELATSERLSDNARAHLSVCALCRAFHDERQSLKRLIGGLGAVNAPPDFDFRLRARISAAKTAGNHHSSWRSFLASAPAIGLAASFALLVAAVVIYNQTKSKPSITENTVASSDKLPEQEPVQLGVNPNTTINTSVDASRASDRIGKDDGGSVSVAVENPRSRKVGGNRNVARREATQPSANDAPVFSNDTAVRPAPQILPNGPAAPFNAAMNPVIELPVRSASQPMRIFVDDKSGAKRTLTLEPVVFGSQDLMGRNTSRASASQGIW
jgi:hypothetical protein